MKEIVIDKMKILQNCVIEDLTFKIVYGYTKETYLKWTALAYLNEETDNIIARQSGETPQEALDLVFKYIENEYIPSLITDAVENLIKRYDTERKKQ